MSWKGVAMDHRSIVQEDGESAQVRLASYLRAVCGLVGVFGTALTKDQANTCMVTIRLCKSPRLAEVSMCLVVLCCASFSMPQLGDLVGRLLALGAGDFCALVAIRFRASFFEELRSNLQDVLQMPISIPDSCLGVMARVFASTAVPEDLISRALDPAALSEQSLEASISVAAQLCKGLGSNQLRSVSSGSLQRWVFRAMQLSTGTVHSELPSLVRQCAKLALRSDSSSKISAQLVLSVMRSGAASPSTKVLLLLYLLEYQSTLVFGDFAEVAVGNEYPPTMWNAVPIRELWLGSSRSSDRAIRDDVYPVLTGLLLRSRPQLLNPVPLVRAHLEAGDLGHTSLRVPNLLIELRNAASDTAKTLPVVRRLHSLAPAEVAQHAGDLLGLLIPKALSSRDSVLLAEVESLWHSIFPFSSDQYLIATVNLLRKPGSRPVGWEELVIDPLVLFQCSDAVFRSASLVRIFLAILTTFRSASRSAYDALYRVESRKTPSLIDASHIKAFLKLQECAVLQSLLKSCLLLQSDADALDARGAIFAYMHQQFIERPEYIQLVLLQGFDSKLMEPVVAGIPSLHVAFDFSTQLVTTTFGIEFLALLTAQYPIKRSLEVAQRVLLPRLQTLLSPVAAFNVALQAGELDVSLPVVPKDAAQLAGACLTLARTFPELSEGIIAILRDANVDARALEGRTDGPVEAWSTYRTIVDQTIEDLRALQRRAAGPT
ncbi:integrator complex subunit 2 [Hyaloraphidium curvatum]|nr:integrator complex subunit 2 [Hyaloraphidium curvatum]